MTERGRAAAHGWSSLERFPSKRQGHDCAGPTGVMIGEAVLGEDAGRRLTPSQAARCWV
jgi:hypothetical protein